MSRVSEAGMHVHIHLTGTCKSQTPNTYSPRHAFMSTP